MNCDTSIFDSDAFLLNTPAGTVDLKTGQIYGHSKDDYITLITSVAPDAEHEGKLWDDFLNTITCGDIELKDFLNSLKNEGVNGAFFSVLDDMAFYISDIFNSTASLANAGISKVFIGSSIGAIPGLANLINQKLSIETIDFDFNKKFEAGDLDASCMNTIRYYYAKYILDDSLNFTAFSRPPAFLKRDGGQFLAVVAIACVLGLIAPIYELGSALYYFGINHFEESKLQDIKKELSILEPDYKSKKSKLMN